MDVVLKKKSTFNACVVSPLFSRCLAGRARNVGNNRSDL